MKGSEATALDDQDVVQKLKDSRNEHFALRLKHATGELENTTKLVQVRRDIARLLTVARQRGIDLEKELRA